MEQAEELFKNSQFLFSYEHGSKSPKNDNYFNIIVGDSVALINQNDQTNQINNTNLCHQVQELVKSNLEKISEYSKKWEAAPKLANSFTDQINIKNENQIYSISTNVQEPEIKAFYEDLIKQLIGILDQNRITKPDTL